MYLIFVGETFYADRPGLSLLTTKPDKNEALVFAEKVLNGRVRQSGGIGYCGMIIEWSEVIDGNTGESAGFYGETPCGSSVMNGKFSHNDYQLLGRDGEEIIIETA